MHTVDPFKLFAAFTGYYLAEQGLRHVVSKYLHRPDFSNKLRASHKDSVYFGILMGACISLFSFPFCATALWQHNILAQKDHAPPHTSLAAEICITSRGVLWVSELNRLDLYPSYVYHHLASIAMLLTGLYLDVLEIFFLPFTTLVSEIPGDFVWILSAHQGMDSRVAESAEWKRRREILQTVNFWMYGLIRVPSIPLTAYWTILLTRHDRALWTPSRSGALFIAVFFYLSIYSGWIVVYLRKHHRQSSSGGWWFKGKSN